jgi:hypothetical protein
MKKINPHQLSNSRAKALSRRLQLAETNALIEKTNEAIERTNKALRAMTRYLKTHPFVR